MYYKYKEMMDNWIYNKERMNHWMDSRARKKRELNGWGWLYIEWITKHKWKDTWMGDEL